MQLKLFTLFIFLVNCSFAVTANNFKPQIGDLLFQDLDCGTLCNGINQVTHGVNNTYMSHVAMVYSIKSGNVMVVEAVSKGVILAPLDKFLSYSHDKNNNPMVIEERLKPQYQYLIPKAIIFTHNQLGKPYNSTFRPNKNKSFYCSSLIYQAFMTANNGKPFFENHAMSFNDPQTGKITNAWQNYFQELHTTAPEGEIGTNPGMMSRSNKLVIVHAYGTLRTHN